MERDFSALLNQFCSMSFSEEEAQVHWYQILSHQKQLEEILGRTVGFTVAMTDYIVNTIRKARNLMLIEKEHFQKTKESAIRDPLTRLYNRSFLRDYLEKEFVKAGRHSIVFSLLFLDVDYFKRINDEHGHLAGDEVLKHISKLLNASSRGSDLVARYGGEEFVIVMYQTLGRKAMDVAERLRKKIEAAEIKINSSGETIKVTVSGGIATCPYDANTPDELLKNADQALYYAKTKGRNRIYHCKDIERKLPKCVNI